MTDSLILIGTDRKSGRGVVWTGKAGEAFASENLHEAFKSTEAHLKAKMNLFNKWSGPVLWDSIVDPKRYEGRN